MTLKEKIEVMQHFENGGEIQFSTRKSESYANATNPLWDWHAYDYRIKPQYIYPLYLECIAEDDDNFRAIARFDSINAGEIVNGSRTGVKTGYKFKDWSCHTNTELWKQVEKPIEVRIEPEELTQVKIEKWLVKSVKKYSVLEGNEEFFIGLESQGWKKVKLLLTYTIFKLNGE